MTDEQEFTLKAARVVAGCSSVRLPYVLKVLQNGGFDLSDEEVLKCDAVAASEDKRRSRKRQGCGEWRYSEDERVLAFRELYPKIQNMCELSRKTGVDRVNLYKYLSGERHMPQSAWEKIRAELEK